MCITHGMTESLHAVHCTTMIEVVPSLPALTFQELKAKLGTVRGLVSTFQIDIADGLFVPSRSWPMNQNDKAQFKRIVKGQETFPYHDEFEFEVHFMAHDPEKLLPDWMKIGISRALFHVEARHDFSTLRARAGDEVELGVSLKIGTPLSIIDQYIEHIGVIQLMGIAEIGIQGQPFDSRVLDSIREAKKRYPDVIIEVDGSVNRETAPSLVAAGATRLAPGSYVFNAHNPKEAINALTSLPL